MSKRNPDGYVVAREAMSPKLNGPRTRTIYWMGPAAPKYTAAAAGGGTSNARWGPLVEAARFVDATLAEHVLRTSLDADQLRIVMHDEVRIEPAPSPRNGGPTSDIITAPPAAAATTSTDDRSEQGNLFGGDL